MNTQRTMSLFLTGALAMAGFFLLAGLAGCPKKTALKSTPAPAPAPAPALRASPDQGVKMSGSEIRKCRSGKDLASSDGKKVRLVGIYRKSLTAKKMRGPKTFLGFVEIELEGQASDYSSTAGPGKPIVQLVGKRPDEEVVRLVDKRVRVDGVLDLDPYRKVREAKVKHAAVIFGPPQLLNPRDLALAGPDPAGGGGRVRP